MTLLLCTPPRLGVIILHMSEIRLLDNILAARIAAGEVIERPQSVVRELVDNAIDAGADEVSVSVIGGGIDSIVVQDNGKGMSKEDLPLALTQYATSKIHSLDDLYQIHTMGFRGEALHSVAAVSRVSIASSYLGGRPWTIRADNGRVFDAVEGGPDQGTIVTVEDLFSEVPARRGFLKRPASEAGLCRSTLVAKAMAFPSVHFSFRQDGILRVDLPKREKLEDRVLDILTLEEGVSRSDFTYLEKSYDDFSLKIVTSLPALRRSDRSRIKIYVNKRPVDEFSLVQAVTHGYGEILPGGAFPYTVLFLEDDSSLVDFNIHPAKREVRIRNKAQVHHEVHSLIHAGLPRQIPTLKAGGEQPGLPGLQAAVSTSWEDPGRSADRLSWALRSPSASYTPHKVEAVNEKPRDTAWLEKAKELFKDRPAKAPQPEPTQHRLEAEATSSVWKDSEVPIRYIGQAFRLFLLCERGDELWLVDQHAAHERLIFNELRQRRDVQPLLTPIEFETEADVDDFLSGNAYIYTQYGIGLTRKADKLWELDSIPHGSEGQEHKLVDFIQKAVGSEEEIEAGLYAIVACHAAIKAGDVIDEHAAKALVEGVFRLEDPSCPHGRTFVIRLKEKDLRLMVGRTN